MIYTNEKLRSIQQKRIKHQAQSIDSYSFFNLLTSPQLLSVVEEQLPEHRERLYPPTSTLSLFLSQALNTDASCQNAVNAHALERVFNGLSSCSTKTGGYCKARQRLPTQMVSSLVKETAQLITAQMPYTWRWHGRQVKLIDGTTITMPDTPANQQIYPQQGGQQPGLGFPIARMVAVICLSSGAILNAAMGTYKGKGSSEHALFRQLLDSFESGDIVLGDAYYGSYFVIALLQERGVDVVFEQYGARKTDFRKGKKLSSRDHILCWPKPKIKPDWMSQEQYNAFADELCIRECKAGGKIVVTTMLSDKQVPKKALADLYRQRWHIELDLRNIKTTLGMQTLSCKTPLMNEKEMWVYFLAYNLIRLIMAEAAVRSNILPRQISFKHALQIWVLWSRQPITALSEDITEQLFLLIAMHQVGNRSGRVEPRAVKRRPKPYKLLTKPRDKLQTEIRKHGHPKKT